MDSRIRIAKELIKIAKSLVAYYHEDEVIGPYNIVVRRIAVGNMRYPGDFICVLGKYADMVKIKDKLKEIGFRYDQSNGWHCFWNKVRWDDVKKVCKDEVETEVKNAPVCPVEQGVEFEADLALAYVGKIEYHDFYGDRYSEYDAYRGTTVKRMFAFSDDAGNRYLCRLTNKSRTWHCDKKLWNADGKDFADGIESMKGTKFHVAGTPESIKLNQGAYEIWFKMK